MQLLPAETVTFVQSATGGRLEPATQTLVAEVDCREPCESTKETSIVSVPGPPLPTYVKQAMPLESVTLVPWTVAFGPLVTLKVTVVPTTGLVPEVIVAQTV